jgi:glycosyltransferase involved in cell wall biosynthesis
VRLNLDSPVEGDRLAGPVIHVRGWAFARRSPVSTVTILFDGQPLGRAGLTWPTFDLAERLGDPRLGLSGFDRVVTLPPELRTPGTHTVAVEARQVDGRTERSAAVRVELPSAPTLPEEVRRPPRTSRSDGPLRGVWLARSLDLGGSQLRTAEMVECLAGRGWRTTVLAPADGPLRARLERAGAAVRLIDPVPLDDPKAYPSAVLRLAHRLRDADLAVAPTVTSFPLVHAAELAGVPAVQRVGEEAPLPTVVSWLIGHLDAEVEAHARRAISGAAAIWTNAHSVEASYRAQGYDGPWHVIHTGRPTVGALPDRTTARRRLGLPEDRRIFVCAGSIWPVKGQGMLAEATRLVAGDHPELLLALVGYDMNPYGGQLRAHLEAHRLTDTVRVAPYDDTLTDWWAAADAVALTPHSPSEALSSALVEGMAHGLPALATRTGDAEVMVEDGRSGWLADHDDLGSLVDAMRRAAGADAATLQTYGERAAARCAEEDDRETAAARAADLLEACAAPTPVR